MNEILSDKESFNKEVQEYKSIFYPRIDELIELCIPQKSEILLFLSEIFDTAIQYFYPVDMEDSTIESDEASNDKDLPF